MFLVGVPSMFANIRFPLGWPWATPLFTTPKLLSVTSHVSREFFA
jgi:hypothetical protein